jgi:uncharacterized protein YxjI
MNNYWSTEGQVKRVNDKFDLQIKKEALFLIDKKLFNITKSFTIDDWRIIRTAEYWETHDNILRFNYPWEEIPNQIECKKFILSQVKQYINKYK